MSQLRKVQREKNRPEKLKSKVSKVSMQRYDMHEIEGVWTGALRMEDWKASGLSLGTQLDCPPYSKAWLIVVVVLINLWFRADEDGDLIIYIVAEAHRWTGKDRLVLPVKGVAA